MPNQRSTTVSLKNLTIFIHYVLLLVYVMTLSTVFLVFWKTSAVVVYMPS